jgi:hypothetical protein
MINDKYNRIESEAVTHARTLLLEEARHTGDELGVSHMTVSRWLKV